MSYIGNFTPNKETINEKVVVFVLLKNYLFKLPSTLGEFSFRNTLAKIRSKFVFFVLLSNNPIFEVEPKDVVDAST